MTSGFECCEHFLSFKEYELHHEIPDFWVSDHVPHKPTIHVAKTKALISCGVSMLLVCISAFAYAKSRFFHDMAQMLFTVVAFQMSLVRKPVFGVSNQVRHKPGCTATEDG